MRYMIDGDFPDKLAQEINVNLASVGDEQVLSEAMETAARKLTAGQPNKVVTTEQLADILQSKTIHGEVFETLSTRAEIENARPGTVKYAGTNNPGIDYHYIQKSTGKWIGVQAKAYQDADVGLNSALQSALKFYGGDLNSRFVNMQKGTQGFEAIIPKDKFEELVRKGALTAEGYPSEKIINAHITDATNFAKGDSSNALRVRTALPEARTILASVKVRPGPVTHAELLRKTENYAEVMRRLNTTVNAALKSSIVKIGGKVLGVAGTVVAAPIMFAQLDNLEARRNAGSVSDELIDKEEFAIYGTAGLTAGVGLALLMFTPAGWVGIGVVGAGVVACWLIDDECFKTLYDRVIQTEESKRAFTELRHLRGERAAHLSGFTIPPDWIVNVDERGSYELAWKNAGSPKPELPTVIKDAEFEAKDTRMWVDNMPNADDILHFEIRKGSSQL